MSNKKILGQYYTVGSPFNHELIKRWFDSIPDVEKASFAEPFAGANNIIYLFNKTFTVVKNSQWTAYDIAPEAVGENKVPDIKLIKRDTLIFPVKANVVVTNPPYIAKNSASKNKFKIDFGIYSNLYEVSLEKILNNADYVCAIIPESFITRGIFKERLVGVISVTENLFDDTGIPVCVALWGKEKAEDFEIYCGNKKIGYSKELTVKLEKLFPNKTSNLKVIFNNPQGLIGVQAIDNTKTASMKFVRGETILPERIKHTSRHITKISILDKATSQNVINQNNLDETIVALNSLLEKYRQETKDVFLTSTKGIRSDGKYRRRLDFKTIVMLIANISIN